MSMFISLEWLCMVKRRLDLAHAFELQEIPYIPIRSASEGWGKAQAGDAATVEMASG